LSLRQRRRVLQHHCFLLHALSVAWVQRDAHGSADCDHTLRRLKRAPEAVPALERALALSRAAEDAPTQSVDLANLGQALIEAGDPVAAAARLQEALTLGPTDAPHLEVAAATLARLGG
jgi:Flp pilus assembly protein TadD